VEGINAAQVRNMAILMNRPEQVWERAISPSCKCTALHLESLTRYSPRLDPDQYWIGRALSMEQYTESRVRAGAASGAEGRTLAPCPPPRLGRKTQGARAHPPIL
jgi:hypothetical protein